MQVWGMALPDHSIRLFKLSSRSDSQDYIDFLSANALPMMEELVEGDFIFQQDNTSIHFSAKTLKWMAEVNLNVMKWPSRSPDLNINRKS